MLPKNELLYKGSLVSLQWYTVARHLLNVSIPDFGLKYFNFHLFDLQKILLLFSALQSRAVSVSYVYVERDLST